MSYTSKFCPSGHLKLLLKPNAFSIPLFAILLAEALFYFKIFWFGLAVHIANLIFIIASAILATFFMKSGIEINRESVDYLQIIMLVLGQ